MEGLITSFEHIVAVTGHTLWSRNSKMSSPRFFIELPMLEDLDMEPGIVSMPQLLDQL